MGLSEIREKIDELDCEMKKLFLKRMGLAEQVALIKAETGAAIYVPEREQEIVEKQTGDVPQEYRKVYTAFIKEVMALSRMVQKEKIASLENKKGD